MPPNSLENKIVSLHIQASCGGCSNKSICYFMNRTKIRDPLFVTSSDRMRVEFLKSGAKVHESICTTDYHYHGALMGMYPNYNITISAEQILYTRTMEFLKPNQTQISVYNTEQIILYRDFQKLYLVKDFTTLDFAKSLFNESNTGKLHIILEQGFLARQRQILPALIQSFQERKNYSLTLDTCLTSFIVNGHCPYDNNNYIDLSWDGTARSCPYTKDGTRLNDKINYNKLKELFSINLPKPNCFYKELFKGNNNERNGQDPNLQDHIANNGFGSDSKRVRRFSLRR